MRNRRKTIEALRRLAERPGTQGEGDAARRLLEKMEANIPPKRPLDLSQFPRGTEVWYTYWCYRNAHGVIVGKEPKVIQGETWLRIKFDDLKQPRRVPVTGPKGCHIFKQPLSWSEVDYWYDSHEYRTQQ